MNAKPTTAPPLPAEIEAIRERRMKITEPSPWEWSYHPGHHDDVIALESGGKDVLLCTGDSDSAWGEIFPQDAEFIAHAPADIDTLLTALAASQQQNDRLTKTIERAREPLTFQFDNGDKMPIGVLATRANAEIDTLRSMLAASQQRVAELERGEQWIAENLCAIMAAAISAMADAAIVTQANYNAEHVLSVVKQLAGEHKRLREQVAELERELIHHAELYNALDEDFGEQCKEIDELTEEMIQLQASSQSVWEQAIATRRSIIADSELTDIEEEFARWQRRSSGEEGKAEYCASFLSGYIPVLLKALRTIEAARDAQEGKEL